MPPMKNSARLVQAICNEWHQSEVTCTLNSDSKTTLILEAGAGNATGKNLTLLINELEKKIGIFVVNVLDSGLLETTILLVDLLGPNPVDCRRSDYWSFSHDLDLFKKWRMDTEENL